MSTGLSIAVATQSAPSARPLRTDLRAEVLALGPPLLVILIFWGLAAHLQAGVAPMTRGSIAVLGTQLPPGFVIWRSIRPRDGWLLEDLAFGAAIGGALAVPAQIVSVLAGAAWITAALPVALGLGVLVQPSSRARVLRARWAPLPGWWGLAAMTGVLASMLKSTEMFGYALPGSARWTVQHPDMVFQWALAGEVAHHMPPHYPQVAGEAMAYHWFSAAWVAQIATVSGVQLDVTTFRFVPVVIGIIFPLTLAFAAMRISGSRAAGPLAMITTAVVGQLPLWQAPTTWTPIWGDSISSSFAAMLLAPLLAVLTLRWRSQTTRGSWTVAALLALVAGGSKATVLPLLLPGCLVAVLVTRRRQERRIAAVDTVTMGVAAIVLIRFVFAGGDGGFRLTAFHGLMENVAGFGKETPLPTGPGLAFAVIAGLSTLLVPWFGTTFLIRHRRSRSDPATWLLLVAASAGTAALALFEMVPANQTWFRFTAQVPLGIALAWGIVLGIRRHRLPKKSLALGVCWGVAASLGVSAVVRRLLSGSLPSPSDELLAVVAFGAAVACGVVACRMRAAPALFIATACAAGAGLALPHWWPTGPVDAQTPFSVSRGQVAAADYVREHSSPDAVVMTNRHCSATNPRICDARHFWYTALSERRVLVEGWSYTDHSTYGRPRAPTRQRYAAPFWQPRLLRLNDGFLRHPTAARADRLWRLGVRWTLVDRTVDGTTALAPFATEKFSTPTAQAWELRPPRA